MARRSLRFNNSFFFGSSQDLLSIQSVTSDKTGEVKFRVVFKDEHGKSVSYLFDELLSVFDFVRSNFK